MPTTPIFWEGAQPLPIPNPLAAYGASILSSSALDLRPPNVPVALTPMSLNVGGGGCAGDGWERGRVE